jgi:soluble lytic murein transglycosylase
MDDTYGVIATLRRTFPNYDFQPPASLPDPVWELLFPVRHWKTISEHAEKSGIEGALVLGIIRQESAFKEAARSSANARGLMQVLPGTGRRLARGAGVSRYTTSKLYRAETNIALGIRQLSSLLERYNRRLELVLAAYNAGEHRVDRWLREFGDTDSAEFVEQIPFSETRGYVRQVLTNMAHYRRLTARQSQ